MELQVNQANVNLEDGYVILRGVDISEVISELGTEKLLEAMDYSDIVDYVGKVEEDKKYDN
jgi:hypothetical protein